MDFQAALPPAVRWITETLEEAGFATWVVGGAIRDLMFGRAAKDWDLATRARPEQIMAAFPRTVPIGVEHGTVGVLARDGTLYEVTTFRRDVEALGRRAVVEFAEDIGDDLARRDFTFNALAWHPLRQDLLDPAGGIADMKAGILRTVGAPRERFSEDFLRVLRALRFAGQFDLTIDQPTWQALLGAVPELTRLSPERVQEEIMKVLSQAQRPSIALRLYLESGALAVLYPEVAGAEVGTGSDPTDFDRALAVCDALRPSRPLVRFVALLALVKSMTGGEAEGVRGAVAGLMERLRFSNADTRRVSSMVATVYLDPPTTDAIEVRRWLSQAGRDHVRDIARIWIAEARTGEEGAEPTPGEVRDRIRTLRRMLSTAPPLSISDLALDGSRLKELGFLPGPRFAEMLSYLLERVLERPELNNQFDLEVVLASGGFLPEAPAADPEAP